MNIRKKPWETEERKEDKENILEIIYYRYLFKEKFYKNAVIEMKNIRERNTKDLLEMFDCRHAGGGAFVYKTKLTLFYLQQDLTKPGLNQIKTNLHRM